MGNNLQPHVTPSLYTETIFYCLLFLVENINFDL